MDKGNPKRVNGEVTCGKRGQFHLNGLAKIRWEEENGREKKEREKREKKRRGERGSFFSLNFLEIRSSAFFGARDKVDPRGESFE